MQPTEQQVQRSLDALRRADARLFVGGDDQAHHRIEDVPTEVLRRLQQAPLIRSERTERARRRLESGDEPSAEAIAGCLVGRLVCDRLR
jgi:hypothetical protein